MRKELALKGIIKILSGIVSPGSLLFLPAGTFMFPGAWRMIGVLFIPMLILGYLLLLFFFVVLITVSAGLIVPDGYQLQLALFS